jgi:uncharacterized membrane protein YtjA (UPF0391 family)
MAKVAEFQPDMVKIGFCAVLVAFLPQTVPAGACFAPAVRPWTGTDAGRRALKAHRNRLSFEGPAMIKWIIILLIVAAAASLLGMPALAGAAATGARILIGIVLVIFLLVILGVFAVT